MNFADFFSIWGKGLNTFWHSTKSREINSPVYEKKIYIYINKGQVC